jgi:hypothetical protein
MSDHSNGAPSGTPTHIAFKIAVYSSEHGSKHVADEDNWVTKDPDYARVSGWVEVRFPLLTGTDFVQVQLEALDARERKLHDTHLEGLKRIQDARRQLLALPAPERASMIVTEQSLNDIPF